MQTRLLGVLTVVLALLAVSAWITLRPPPPPDWDNLDDGAKSPLPTIAKP